MKPPWECRAFAMLRNSRSASDVHAGFEKVDATEAKPEGPGTYHHEHDHVFGFTLFLLCGLSQAARRRCYSSGMSGVTSDARLGCQSDSELSWLEFWELG